MEENLGCLLNGHTAYSWMYQKCVNCGRLLYWVSTEAYTNKGRWEAIPEGYMVRDRMSDPIPIPKS